jgi:hypothetical protein
MTRDERRQLRMLAGDLEAQIDRCDDPTRRDALRLQLEGVRREQAYDKQVSPRSGKRGKRK